MSAADMPEAEQETKELLVARITIECTLDEEGEEHIATYVETESGDSNLPLRESLGFLDYARLQLAGLIEQGD